MAVQKWLYPPRTLPRHAAHTLLGALPIRPSGRDCTPINPLVLVLFGGDLDSKQDPQTGDTVLTGK